VRPLPALALETAKSKRTEPRIPFGTIIELRILEPGIVLTDERGRLRAEVKADGSLSLAGRQGSIHRLGAEVQGKAACNGWTFWHYEAQGVLKPIDALREQARRRLGLSAPVGGVAATE
jgi:modification methylase